MLRDFRHPVTVLTKGALIERDADILGEMGRAGLAVAGLSVTTLDRKLARAMEPRAAAPERRLPALRRLAEAGCPTRVSIGAGDPRPQRPRDRGAARGGAGRRRVRAPATSCCACRARSAPLFRDWLERALSRPREAGDGPGARAARRPGLRPAVGPADEGRGRHRPADRPPLPPPPPASAWTEPMPKLRTDLFRVPRRGRSSCRCSEASGRHAGSRRLRASPCPRITAQMLIRPDDR